MKWPTIGKHAGAKRSQQIRHERHKIKGGTARNHATGKHKEQAEKTGATPRAEKLRQAYEALRPIDMLRGVSPLDPKPEIVSIDSVNPLEDCFYFDWQVAGGESYGPH